MASKIYMLCINVCECAITSQHVLFEILMISKISLLQLKIARVKIKGEKEK